MNKAVLFDLDGTLLDTLEDLADSMNRVLQRMGYPQHPVDQYRFMVGDGMEILSQRVLPPEVRETAVAQNVVKAMLEEYGQHWADKTRPYEGIPELLNGLTDKGIPFAVFSNKAHHLTQFTVSHFFTKWKFAAVLGARPGFPKKPEPAGALEIARDLGVSPKDFLYVGDTNTDMKTALGAGMVAIGALWGFRSREELLASGAQKLIQNPVELLQELL